MWRNEKRKKQEQVGAAEAKGPAEVVKREEEKKKIFRFVFFFSRPLPLSLLPH